jgi:hypothetical protein
MRKLNSSINVITSDPAFPNGRIRNNTGTGNGTPVNEQVYGDIHTNKDKLLDLYGIDANGLPDNETNGYQYIDALRALASKNDFILPLTNNAGVLSVPIKLGFMVENEQVICKAGFDLGVQTEIKGLDASTFSFTSNGSFKTNEYVRLIKTSSGIQLVILADYIPNLANRLNDIESAQTTINQKLAVFTVNGVMFIWRKAGAIPTGFQEVTDYRGKTVFGMDATQTEFAVLGSFSGSKDSVVVSHVHEFSNSNSGGVGGGFITTGNADEGSGTFGMQSEGESGVGKNLPPYGVIRFIEWATV